MSENSETKHVPSQSVVVHEDTHQNEVTENIDSELYTIDCPTNSFHKLTIEPDGDLAEALRNDGYTVEFRDR